ncbi:PQQ-dependent sugar dehydrogenase [Pseudoalteromonas sp. Scap03]|uniref:PQQ-dependent sugar dehydrogenase n=1 Tax=unclassified Pseudoalteromonas TaxID=194690 RepID=UPI0015B871C4|nr:MULTISPECIES: PQQ-dependent sugar dehydrogenase [unclassified Pseudoalteromonas]NWL16526.1 PQQ-dependent sugar dehydrogenase [Pseudoalteromonas sp. Scap03]QLE81637.1 PQQ-dependent sugar dehydrogenase [Pseudoalteromonas sp. Scap25]QLE89581.1 PQQ-dependent sugar dehydrogenase [Pseudoalteromonas sp. Scap06]
MNKVTTRKKFSTLAKISCAFALSGLTSLSTYAVDFKELDKLALNVKPVTVAQGISIPWAIEALPNGDLLITERSGILYLLRNNSTSLTKITGLPKIDANGQGGLLDLELHPDFANNQWLYITYSSSEGDGAGSNTALMRAKLSNDHSQLLESQQLYKGEHNSKKGQHYGSRIVFDNQNYVYFSIGDRGSRDINPQDLGRDGGKIYRLHDDGKIPSDNPFVNQKGAKPAVWSYGHRNPQGMWFDGDNSVFWAHEHGPRGGDELNMIKPKTNYGWPVVSYGINYSGTSFTDLTEKPGMQAPILQWTPSIAPSDMLLVKGDKYPELKGKFLLASMKYAFVSVLEIVDGKVVKQSKLLEGIGRIRSLAQGDDGTIYLGLDGQGIVRLGPK